MFIDSHLHISPGFPDVRDRSFITSGGGEGAGFLKNRVYENFTPPPPPSQKKKIFQTNVLLPTAMTVGKFYPTTPPMVGLVVELLRSSRAQRLVTCGKSLAL